MYASGTLSMLLISMLVSLSLWIALPWAFLGWSPTLVTSGSMTPLVTPGDVVMVRPVSAGDLGPDTVVLYDRPETGRILHRIVEALPDGSFRTKGDANASPDSALVQREDVRGVAVLSVPWIGRPSLWLYQGHTARLVLTAGVALLLVTLAPRAYDRAFDPWGSTRRVNPAEVLLDGTGTGTDRPEDDGSRLLPGGLHDLVHQRLAGQGVAVARRTAHLVEGLS
jgi:signal peptidase I